MSLDGDDWVREAGSKHPKTNQKKDQVKAILGLSSLGSKEGSLNVDLQILILAKKGQIGSRIRTRL